MSLCWKMLHRLSEEKSNHQSWPAVNPASDKKTQLGEKAETWSRCKEWGTAECSVLNWDICSAPSPPEAHGLLRKRRMKEWKRKILQRNGVSGPVLPQARQNPTMERGGGHEILTIDKELLLGERQSAIFKDVTSGVLFTHQWNSHI